METFYEKYGGEETISKVVDYICNPFTSMPLLNTYTLPLLTLV